MHFSETVRGLKREAEDIVPQLEVWARVQKYWAETNAGNERDALAGYAPGMLQRCDFKTLKEDGKFTGDIASEIARRTTDSAQHVVFLDIAFL